MEWLQKESIIRTPCFSSALHFRILVFGIPGYFIISFLGLLFKITGTVNPLMIMIVYSIPLCIFFIFAYKAVFSNDCYLAYFKKFEKEDAAWHKKWERRTIAFCIGSILSNVTWNIFSNSNYIIPLALEANTWKCYSLLHRGIYGKYIRYYRGRCHRNTPVILRSGDKHPPNLLIRQKNSIFAFA